MKKIDNYMKICENVSNIIKKKLIVNLHIIKIFKSWKKFNTKESFQWFYIPVILFDSVYRKDENCYPKVFLEKFIHKFFWRNKRNFVFLDFWSSS